MCEPELQYIGDAAIVNALTEQTDEEENGRMNKDQGNRDHIRCSMALVC